MTTDRLTFLAALAPSPMRVMADGGYCIYLDVPEDELGAVMQLILLRKEYLRITVEVTNDDATTKDRDRYFEN
jgi:hypothetical protein